MRKTSVIASMLAMALGGVFAQPSVNPVSINPNVSESVFSNGKIAPENKAPNQAKAQELRAIRRIGNAPKMAHFSSPNKVSQQKRRKYARQTGVYA